MKSFTLVEVLIVLIIYTLALAVVVPYLRKSSRSDVEDLEIFILRTAQDAYLSKREIIVMGHKGVVRRNDGKKIFLRTLKEGFCLVKPSGRFYMCEFKFTNKIVRLSPLGKFMITN